MMLFSANPLLLPFYEEQLPIVSSKRFYLNDRDVACLKDVFNQEKLKDHRRNGKLPIQKKPLNIECLWCNNIQLQVLLIGTLVEPTALQASNATTVPPLLIIEIYRLVS